MRFWSSDPDKWKRRSSIICQLNRKEETDICQLNRKEETDLALLFDCIDPNLTDPRLLHPQEHRVGSPLPKPIPR